MWRIEMAEPSTMSAAATQGPPRGAGSSAGTPHPSNPGRLIYAEAMDIDAALIGGPPTPTGTSLEE
jgi:hypothetical protein